MISNVVQICVVQIQLTGNMYVVDHTQIICLQIFQIHEVNIDDLSEASKLLQVLETKVW